MKTLELGELIKSRRSIRAWDKKPVAKELLLQAIELATYAPNGGNQQNWKFFVILNKSTINAIADAVQQSANYSASWPEMTKLGDMAMRMIQRASFFRDAPAAIAVASAQYQSPVDQALASRALSDPRAAEMRNWRNIANSRIQSAASAVAYLLLVLHQMGLGAVWMTGPLQAKGDIEKILKVPAELDLIAFIPVGYPAESPALRQRKPVSDVCQVIA